MNIDLNDIRATLSKLVSRLKEEIDRISNSCLSGVSGQSDPQVGILSALNVRGPFGYSLPCLRSPSKEPLSDVRDRTVVESLPGLADVHDQPRIPNVPSLLLPSKSLGVCNLYELDVRKCTITKDLPGDGDICTLPSISPTPPMSYHLMVKMYIINPLPPLL